MSTPIPGGGKPNLYLLDRGGRLEHAARTSRTGPGAPGYGTRLQRSYARLGVAVGFLIGVVPGVAMRRDYLAWRAGERPTPGAAGPVGAITFWLLVGSALWSGAGLEPLAVLVAVTGLLPSLVVASRG